MCLPTESFFLSLTWIDSDGILSYADMSEEKKQEFYSVEMQKSLIVRKTTIFTEFYYHCWSYIPPFFFAVCLLVYFLRRIQHIMIIIQISDSKRAKSNGFRE